MVDARTRAGQAAFVASLAAVAIGVSVLAGWLFGWEVLKRGASGLMAMNPATAVGFILAGASLALRLSSPPGARGRTLAVMLARLLGLTVTLGGLAKLVDVGGGWDLGVDRWLFTSAAPNGLGFPDRMAPTTALNFLLLGGALLGVDVPRRSVRLGVECSALIVGFGSLLAILAYAFDVPSFSRFGAFVPMALHTAVTFLLLGSAVLLSHADDGWLALFAEDNSGGTLARRLTPAAVLVPAVLGWLTWRGQKAGVYGGEFSDAIFSTASIVVFTFLTFWSARQLSRTDSARRQAEEVTRESNEKFHQLADNITDAFWIRSPDMAEVQYVSPAFEQIWGRSVESLYANPKQWIDFIVPEDRERVRGAFAALTKDAPTIEVEYRIARPDGEIRWVRARGFQVRDAASLLVRHTGIVTDITDRHRVEEELRESERRFQDMLGHLDLVSMMADRQGRVTYCSDFLLRLTGWQREDVIGRDWFEMFVPPSIVDKMREVFSALLADQPSARHQENAILTRSGAQRLIDWSNSVLRSASGDVIGTASIGEDVTERKRLEGQLFQAQKMEVVGKLAGGVAHEFNSILTAIIGQSELLLGDLPAGSPLTRNATEIRQAAGRAAALTRQLLAYGRQQLLQMEALDLNPVLASMDGIFRNLMGGNVDTLVVPAPGLHPVRADAGQIEQVIMNMVINARDAMPNGGRLTLETANVTFDEHSVERDAELKPGDYVMLAITDTGAGMTEDVKARVFEPFFTTKVVGQGSGLGLSTSYGIVKQCGGHISVYSEPGRGTTFKIYLPQADRLVETAAPRLDSPDLPRGTETILLVEDDPALREMEATLLRRLGYTVKAAANGIEALSLRQQPGVGHIDVLFTDVVMPHMTGMELADRVRALCPHTRILFTSAYTANAAVHQGILNKDVTLLPKPSTPSALARMLRAVLDQPAAPRPVPATVGQT